jgi:hypothetical protein
MEYASGEAFFLLTLRRLHISPQARRAGSFWGHVFCLEDFDPATVPVRATEGVGMSVVDPNARSQWPGPREAS